jgi:hypothetical protein
LQGSAADSTSASSQTLQRNSDDMGWEFATLIDPLDLQRVKCKLCEKEMHGGVNRMKQHIAGIKWQVSTLKLHGEPRKAGPMYVIKDGNFIDGYGYPWVPYQHG